MEAEHGSPRGVVTRAWQRAVVVLVGLAALLGLGLGAAPGASAHASLLFTTPGVGTSVAAPPHKLTLIFDQSVDLSGRTATLSGPNGRSIPLGATVRDTAGSVLTVPVSQILPPDVYTVSWQVLAQDGDVITGSFRFAVGPAAPGALASQGTGATASRGQTAMTVFRWLVFAALALVWGEAVGVRLSRRRLSANAAGLPRLWTAPAALVGLLGALGLGALIVGDGSLEAVLTHPAIAQLSSRAGQLAVAEMTAFSAAVLLARWGSAWSWTPLVAVVGAEAWRAHPEAFAPGWGALVTAAHLTAAALWFGTLVYVVRCLLNGDRHERWALLGAYARLAGWLFAAVLASGVWATLIVTPLGALLRTGYGQLLLFKAGLIATTALLALVGRNRLRGRGENGLPVSWMRAESGALAGVLAVAAVLTAVAPPRQSAGALPVAPPPTGPVVPAGARAGQIGIGVQASAGQLVVRLTAPGAERAGADAGYRLAAVLADPSGQSHRLALRGCGTGCFVANVAWRTGASHLSLRADSRDWPGGTASLAVPWPPADGAPQLRELAQLLDTIGVFTLYEQVTSNAVGVSGPPQSLTLTGPRFLGAEPYSGGRATYTVTAPATDGGTLLLLGFPAEQVQVALTLDAQGRPERETLTDANHLVNRTFVYHGIDCPPRAQLVRRCETDGVATSPVG